jgi:hypothetical protein
MEGGVQIYKQVKNNKRLYTPSRGSRQIIHHPVTFFNSQIACHVKIKENRNEMEVPRANISAESTIENTWVIHSPSPFISRPSLEERMKIFPWERFIFS